MYTWRKEWIREYESPWSILEKFKYANAITNKDIYSILGKTKDNGDLIKSQSKAHKSYITLDGFDENRVINTLGVNIKQMNSSNLINILNMFFKNGSIKKYVQPFLNICPFCIKKGYHSIWHQIIFFNECFIHQSTFINKCPACTRGFFYEFETSNNTHGFKCTCGYSFINSHSQTHDIFFNKWEHDKIEINIKQKHWLEMNKKNNMTMYYFGHDYNNSHIDINHFNYALSDTLIEINRKNNVLMSKHNILSCRNKKIKNNVNFKKEFSFSKEASYPYMQESDIEELFCLYKSILKSISRKIMKKDRFIRKYIKELQVNEANIFHLGEVIKCFDLDLEEVSKPFIYPSSYAYLMWRKDIEGLDSYTKVHNKISNIFTSVIQTRLFWYFEYLWVENKHNNNFEPKDFKCILGHMMAYMFIEHYNNWLKFISKYLNSSKYLNTLNSTMVKLIYDEMPIFIIKHLENSKFIELYKYNNPCDFYNRLHFDR